MTIEIKEESFPTAQDNQIGGYINKNNLTKWTISGNDHSLKLLGRTVGANKPLIIGFHGWLGSQNNHFYDLSKEDVDEASLIFPQDRCGYLRAGSWYLGELTGNNEYTYPALLKIFLDNIVKEIKPSKIIAFGTSMGGFGAWSLSTYFDLDEVYLCVPQTSLNPRAHYFNRDTKDYEKTTGLHSKQLSGLGISSYKDFKSRLISYPFIDATYFSRLIQTMPSKEFKANGFLDVEFSYKFSKYYHLVATRYDHHQDVNGTYFNDMILPLINTLSKNNICFSSAIFPFSGHDAYIYPPHIFNYTNNAYEDVKANKLKERLSAKDRCNNPPYWRPLLIV